jgi:peptide/nickel transport system substrate-binding protein
MRNNKISRRKFLHASALGLGGVILAACAPTPPSATAPAEAIPTATTAAAQPTATTAPAAPAGGKSARGFVEPPFLADRVKAGKLPPIDQRLPDEAFVVGAGTLIQEQYSTWKNGQYGGDINIAADWGTGFLNIAQSSTILRSPSQSTNVSKPNVVSAYKVSDDYTTYTLTLRKGLKWSDGEPVTTEDVRFVFEDLYGDPAMNYGWDSSLYTDGNSSLGPAKLTIQDENTFTLTFSQPYGAFIASLNSWIPSYDIMIRPAHYLKQFHSKYAKKEDLDALLKANNETDWTKLLNSKNVSHWDMGEIRALGMPCLNAWVLVEATDQRRIFERNPYFWHVDSNGLQLPYIDRVVNNIAIDSNGTLNAIMAGKVDLAGGNNIALSQMPTLVQTASQFNRKIFTTGSFNFPIMLFLNHDFEYDKADSVWQKMITDSDNRFGKAIAAAMDPEEVNKSVFFGKFGKPMMNATGPDLPLANKLLDDLGFDKKGSDGLRLGPDGQPFIFRITFYTSEAPEEAPIAELLKEQIQKAGIHVELDVIDGSLWNQRITDNSMMASLKWNDGEAWYTGISEDFLPASKGPWSPVTWLYFTSNGKNGRKPPQYIQDFYDLYTARKAYPPESDKGMEIYNKLFQWMSDHYVMIPTVGHQVKPNSVNAKLQNLPNEGAPFDLDVYINAEGYWYAS